MTKDRAEDRKGLKRRAKRRAKEGDPAESRG